jgi:membrane protease YdiL (CAAX protease family)
MVRTLRAVAWAAVLALVVAGFFSLTWGALLTANLLTTPAIPWSVAVMVIVLVVVLYLGGRWGPASTADWRRAHLRARLVPGRVVGWALLAGALALVALIGLWIVLVELTTVGGNPTIPSAQQVPPFALGLLLVMGSFVSSLTEEAAFRGYAQVTLERVLGGGVGAVALSSLFFMLWHGPTQGFQWSKLLFYFVVGVVFGTIAFLAKSTVPAWPIHLAGDLIFFFLIWPHDATRRYIVRDGADVWFWVYAAATVVFTVLAILAFRRLAFVARARQPQDLSMRLVR